MSSELSFDQDLYHVRVPYDEVQHTADLISVGFNQEVDTQAISRASIVQSMLRFSINSTSLIIRNVVPLESGRSDFLLVVLYNSSVLTAAVVVDVLSQSKK